MAASGHAGGHAKANSLRPGMRALLRGELARTIARVSGAPDTVEGPEAEARLDGLAERLEHAAFARVPYTENVRRLVAVLKAQTGVLPDDVPAWRCWTGELAPADAAAMPEPPPLAPRDVIRRSLARALLRWAPDAAPAQVRALATGLERGAYRATLASSRGGAPLQRTWGTPEFTELYSAYCGRLLATLDPDAAPSRVYGARLAARLLAGELAPEAAGAMSERELCPAAFAVELAEIQRRLAQKVEAKGSKLFQCPHCQARDCTFREVQTRSADEPPDYFCSCLGCGRPFKGRH